MTFRAMAGFPLRSVIPMLMAFDRLAGSPVRGSHAGGRTPIAVYAPSAVIVVLGKYGFLDISTGRSSKSDPVVKGVMTLTAAPPAHIQKGLSLKKNPGSRQSTPRAREVLGKTFETNDALTPLSSHTATHTRTQQSLR